MTGQLFFFVSFDFKSTIEAFADVKTTDGYVLRIFSIAFTKNQRDSRRETAYAQHTKVNKLLFIFWPVYICWSLLIGVPCRLLYWLYMFPNRSVKQIFCFTTRFKCSQIILWLYNKTYTFLFKIYFGYKIWWKSPTGGLSTSWCMSIVHFMNFWLIPLILNN